MFSQAKSSKESCSSEAVKDKAIIGQTSLVRIASSGGERTRARDANLLPFLPCMQRERGCKKEGERRKKARSDV